MFIPLQPTLPRGLAVSVAPSRCQSSQNPGPKPRAPAGPCNGKQMADPLTAAGCSRQSRRGNFSFAVIHHWAGSGGRRGGGKTEQRLTPDVWPLSNAFAWHIHGSHSYTHAKTHTYTWGVGYAHKHTHTHTHTRTHIQTSEYILAHGPVSCLSLVVLFFSALGRPREERERKMEYYCFFCLLIFMIHWFSSTNVHAVDVQEEEEEEKGEGELGE